MCALSLWNYNAVNLRKRNAGYVLKDNCSVGNVVGAVYYNLRLNLFTELNTGKYEWSGRRLTGLGFCDIIKNG